MTSENANPSKAGKQRSLGSSGQSSGMENDRTRRSRWWAVLEVAGVVAVIVYAIVTVFMWRDSHNNFIVQERAWINVESRFPDQPVEGSSLEADIRLSNTGATPAKRVDCQFSVVLVQRNEQVPVDYSGYPRRDFMAIMTPGTSLAENVLRMGSPEESIKLSKAEIDDLTSGRAYVAVFGRGVYYDVFGRLHWFQYCNWKAYYSGPEVMTYYPTGGCAEYNDFGDGALPK